MYHQLGSTIFDGLFSYHEYERKVKKEFAELKIINGKPDLHDVGTELEAVDMAIRLHESFCNPSLRYEELRSYCNNGDILPFLDGSGNLIGNFVLTELSQAVTQTNTKGEVTLCECKIILKEYVDPNRDLTRAVNAKRNAFALTARSLPIKISGPPPAPAPDLFDTIRPLNAGISATTGLVKLANQDVSTRAAFIKRAITSVSSVLKNAQLLQDKVSSYAAQGFSVATAFTDANTAILSNANSLLTSLRSGDIAASVTNSSLLLQSGQSLTVASLPLCELSILR